MNTAMGNILAVVLAISILFVGIDSVFTQLGIPMSLITAFAPFIIALVNNLSPLTSSAISMEGKGFEQTKSLPVSAKTVMDAKLLLQYTFSLPTSLICSTSFCVALGAKGAQILWIFILPFALSLLCGALSLLVNVKFPCLSWDTPSVPVKQSSSTLLCMLASIGMIILSAVAMLAVGENYTNLMGFLLTAAYLAALAFIYKKLASLRLNEIDEK